MPFHIPRGVAPPLQETDNRHSVNQLREHLAASLKLNDSNDDQAAS